VKKKERWKIILKERERNITDILGGPSNNKYGYKAFLKC